MRRALAILLCCLTVAPPARAGGWMRETGQFFLSTGNTLRKTPESLASNTEIYGEYGLKPRLTLGVAINDTSATYGHVIGFLRFPLGNLDKPHSMSLELGAGSHYRIGQWHAMFKSTLAYGRGFERRWGHGWMNIEATLERRLGEARPIYKLDTTIGQSSGARLRPMFKLGASHISGQPLSVTGSAHLMFDTKGKKKKTSTWVLGIERKTGAVPATGIGFEVWRKF
ncbi:hypothetical protein ACXYMO_09860 [Arenibacterium sp. CAU 1754]